MEMNSQYSINYLMNVIGFDTVQRDLARADKQIDRLLAKGGKLSGITGSFSPKGYQWREWSQRERSGKMGTRSAWFGPGGKRVPTSQVPEELRSGPIQRPLIQQNKELNKVNEKSIKINKQKEKSMASLAGRAMSVIPIWMALRSVYMGVFQFIGSNIKVWAELEVQMGRVATVTRGTTEDLQSIKSAIVDYASTSVASFKDVANVMYALGSAGLNVTEQMAGLKPVMDLTIGSFGDAEQIAKLVAGSYNVFGKAMDGVYTKSTKMKKISDILAYTYSTQQVELSEIATAMTYVGSVGTLLDVKFDDLVGTIGFLNTGMLKGTKAGTSLFNAFIRLASQSDKLGKIGVAFDPSQPLNYINVMTQLSNIYGSNALSLTSLKELMDVFGRRGGRAVAQIISDFDRWKDTIDDTKNSFEDFAEKMKKEAEDNLPKAFSKLGNAIKGSFINVIGDTGGLKNYINELTKGLESLSKFDKYGKHLSATSKAEGLFAKAAITTEAVGTSAISALIGTLLGGPIGGIAAGATGFGIGQTRAIKKFGKSGTPERFEEELGGREDILDIYDRVVASKDKVVEKTKEQSQYQKDLEILGKRLAEHPEKEVQIRAILAGVLNRELGMKEKYLANAEKINIEAWKQIEIQNKGSKVAEDEYRELKRQSTVILENAKYEDLKLKGVTKSNIEYAKLKDMITKINELVIEVVAEEKLKEKSEQNQVALNLKQVDITKVLSGEYDGLYQAIHHTSIDLKEGLNIQKQSLEVMRELTKEAQEFSNVIKDSLTESFKGMLSGEQDIGDLFQNMTDAKIDSYRDMVSEGFSEMVMSSGMGETFGISMKNARTGLGLLASKIESSFNKGGQITHDWIIKGFAKGTDRAISGSSGSSTASFMGGGVGGTIGGAIGMLNPFGGYTNINGQLMVPQTTNYGGGATGTTYKPASGLQKAGYYGVQGAVTGYNAYQSATAGGIPEGQALASGIMTGAGSAMFAGGMGAAMAAGVAMGPVGWIGLGIMAVGMALGMFGGKDSSWSKTETKTSERRISSRIDITNKNLEVINRNLVALRQELTYIMPRSYYFSERDTVEDDFSLSRRRGAEG